MKRLLICAIAIVTAAATLGGCAALNSVSSDVSSFGEWPADRKPGSYAFERLPSQQSQAAQADALEAAARGALAKAGFKPVEAGSEPDVLVQVGLRTGRNNTYPWADSWWWRGNFGYYRHGPWLGPNWGFGMSLDHTRYEREVALLMRDRASGKPVFEARASNESSNAGTGSATLSALFEAALMDFPRLGMNPRRVVVPLPG